MTKAARSFRTAAIVLAWSAAPAVVLGTGMPAVAAEAKVPDDAHPAAEPVSGLQGSADAEPVGVFVFPPAVAETGADQSTKERAPGVSTNGPMAQFQLPPETRFGRPIRPVAQILRYQYSYGSESEVNYRRNPDLDDRIRDNLLLLKPQLNGVVIYRPASWLETTLEVILEREFAVHEQEVITLPNGETQFAPKRRTSLLVDQAFATIKGITAPFEFHVGRRNYEDERHWLYDTSMDIAAITLKQGSFRAEALVGREILWDLDLLDKEVKDRINTYMLTADYRGIEDIRLTAYTVFRDDRAKQEGRPLLLGVSAYGMPSDRFSFWTQLASLRGSDENRRKYSAYGYDVGGTYRFTSLPLHPSVTLAYAYATGDGNPEDGRNNEFRQTGLQSNEGRFDGVSQFKVYGETLDPELGNLKILTAGLGFRPAPNVSVDFVYHRYRLDEIADAIRNSALTAQMNQDDTQHSKDVGAAVDLVIGIRNLFGIRRLGLDLRNGLFLPGKAFRNADGAPGTPAFRKADRGSTIVAKFWW